MASALQLFNFQQPVSEVAVPVQIKKRKRKVIAPVMMMMILPFYKLKQQQLAEGSAVLFGFLLFLLLIIIGPEIIANTKPTAKGIFIVLLFGTLHYVASHQARHHSI